MWRHVVIEGYCLARDKPCGYETVSWRCLQNGFCPHFAYTGSNEREAAFFAPLHLILWDRIRVWLAEELWGNLCWWFWDSLWFNRRKTQEFFDNIPIVESPEWDKMLQEAKDKFSEWEAGIETDGK